MLVDVLGFLNKNRGVKRDRIFLITLLAIALLRILVSGFGGLHIDEAYYWVWSQHLSFAYFDHPPMVAWLIALGDRPLQFLVPGFVSKLAPEFFALVSFRWLPILAANVVAPLFLCRAIELLQNRGLSWMQFALIATAPVFVFGPHIITPDTPLFLFWSMLIWALLRLRLEPASVKKAVLLGAILGCCALSKYTAVLAAAVLVFSGIGWRNLAIVAGTSFVFVLPNLIAGAELQKISAEPSGVLFQIKHGFGDGLGGRHWNKVFDLWIIQIFFWAPVTFVATFAALFGRPSRDRLTLFLLATVPVVFFSFSALQKKAEGNWPLVGVLTALVLLATMSRKPIWLAAGLVSNILTAALGAVLLFNSSLLAPLFDSKLPHIAAQLRRPSRVHEFTGWGQLRDDLFKTVKSDSLPVFVKSYQNLSEMLFFDRLREPQNQLGGRLKFSVIGSRRSQYNLMPEYLSTDSEFWLFDNDSNAEKTQCPLIQTLVKGSSNQKNFWLMKCGSR